MVDGDGAGPGRATGARTWGWPTWRLVVAVVVLVVLVAVVGVGTFGAGLRVCGGPGVVATCRPLAWSDPFVGLSLLLVLLLGLPEVTRLEAGPEGVKIQREPGLPPNADLERRVAQLEATRVPQWYRETEGEDDGRAAAGT